MMYNAYFVFISILVGIEGKNKQYKIAEEHWLVDHYTTTKNTKNR